MALTAARATSVTVITSSTWLARTVLGSVPPTSWASWLIAVRAVITAPIPVTGAKMRGGRGDRERRGGAPGRGGRVGEGVDGAGAGGADGGNEGREGSDPERHR